MATYSTTLYSSKSAPHGGSDDRVISFNYTIAGAITDGDIVNLVKLPAGYTVIGLQLATSAGVASTGGTIKIGTNDGTTNSAVSLLASTVATGAVTVALAQPATLPVMAAEGTVYATLNGTSGFTTGTVLKGLILATPFTA
jgi:hypothetical protein